MSVCTSPREVARALQAMTRSPQGSKTPSQELLWRAPPLRLPPLKLAPSAQLLGSGARRGVSVYDLAPYREGDDLRQLDWRRYLNSGERLVRRYEPEGVGELLVQLDASATLGASEGRWRALLHVAQAVSEGALLGGARVWWLIERAGEARLEGPLLGTQALHALTHRLATLSPSGARASALTLAQLSARLPVGSALIALSDLCGADLSLGGDPQRARAQVSARWALPRGCVWSLCLLLRTQADLTPPTALVRSPGSQRLHQAPLDGSLAQRELHEFRARLEAHFERWIELSRVHIEPLWWTL